VNAHDDDLRLLEELDALPDGHPRRAEILRDPAIRALHDSYRAFMTGEAAGVPGIERAEDALSAFRGEHVVGITPMWRPAASAERRVVEAPRAPWWRALLAPAMRPVLAFGALALVAGAVWLAVRPGGDPAVPTLRGGKGGSLELQPARVTERGIELSWHPHPEADQYEVVFYTSKLTHIMSLGETADTFAVVPHSTRTLLARGGTEVLYRVVARREGDEVTHSPVAGLPR
jgi:hypothetical protein